MFGFARLPRLDMHARYVLLIASAAAAATAPGDLDLTLLPSSVSPGGRCLDGSMAGYYFRQGVADTFVILLKAGGGCYTEESCTSRAKGPLGSSKKWQSTYPTTTKNTAVSDECGINPHFCNATAAIVPYCTGDTHRGNNTSPSAATWGLYFDGHANLAAIVDELVAKRGLGDAKHVLLTGGSAGGIGTFYNVDWLAARLPAATVKGAPNAGWFFPAALPSDLPAVYPPSDFPHFSAGGHGNAESADASLPVFLNDVLYQSRGLFPPACIAAQKPGEWWACSSVDKLYRYIKSPLYIIENQYDVNQINVQELVPKQAANASEADAMTRYVVMYGEAMRNSTAQVTADAPVTKKAQPDGIFHPSCFQHTVNDPVEVQGQKFLLVLGDWYFELNRLQQYHRLVETCPAEAAGLPCNANRYACAFSAGPVPGPPPPAPPAPPGPPKPPLPPPLPPSPECEKVLAQYCKGPFQSAQACTTCCLAHADKSLCNGRMRRYWCNETVVE